MDLYVFRHMIFNGIPKNEIFESIFILLLGITDNVSVHPLKPSGISLMKNTLLRLDIAYQKERNI